MRLFATWLGSIYIYVRVCVCINTAGDVLNIVYIWFSHSVDLFHLLLFLTLASFYQWHECTESSFQSHRDLEVVGFEVLAMSFSCLHHFWLITNLLLPGKREPQNYAEWGSFLITFNLYFQQEEVSIFKETIGYIYAFPLLSYEEVKERKRDYIPIPLIIRNV